MAGLDRDQLRAWSASLDVVVGLIAFGVIGWLIDRWTGHAPWWMLGLGALGLGAGSYKFVREALAINAEGERERRAAADRGSAPASGAEDGRGSGAGSRSAGMDAEKPGSDGSPGA